jgi:hypothetical protein
LTANDEEADNYEVIFPLKIRSHLPETELVYVTVLNGNAELRVA